MASAAISEGFGFEGGIWERGESSRGAWIEAELDGTHDGRKSHCSRADSRKRWTWVALIGFQDDAEGGKRNATPVK